LGTEVCKTWYGEKIEIDWDNFHMLNIKNIMRDLEEILKNALTSGSE